jgi:lactoylglutathione lyase
MDPWKITGIILLVADYQRSVTFWRDQVSLPIWYEKPHLTCFRFGGSYLMIEPRYGKSPAPPPPGEHSPVLRLNVESIDESLKVLVAKGLKVERMEFEWGIVGDFRDPDGNKVQLCQWPKEIYER